MNNNDDNKGDIDMLLPRRNYNLFDEFFDNDFWGKGFSKFEAPSMKTDVKDVDGNYELSIELPGFNKEDITASLKDGYLTVSAKHEENDDKKDENDKYIRREKIRFMREKLLCRRGHHGRRYQGFIQQRYIEAYIA